MSGIIININRKPRKGIISAAERSGGIIRGPRRRRMLPKKRRVGGINFYDLGQIRSGENWVDLPFSRSRWDGLDPIEFDISFLNDLQDLIFSVNISDWRSTYRKFTYAMAERYGVDFLFDGGQLGVGRSGSRWKIGTTELITENYLTEQGFLINALPNEWELISYGGGFRWIGTTEDYKITDTLDYNAAAVPFELQSGADIFLVPAISSVSIGEGSIGNTIGGVRKYMDTDRILEAWFAGLSSTILSRELFLSRNDSQGAVAGYPNNDIMTFATNDALYHDNINQTAAYAYALSISEVGGHTVYDPPPGLPGPGVTTPMSPADVLAVSYVQEAVLYHVLNFPESLAGVIVQESGTYYIWRSTEDVLGRFGGPSIKIK